MGGKKGLGGLTPAKKKLLKDLIMKLAMEELKREEEERKQAKLNYLNERVGDLAVEGKSQSQLTNYVNDLYEKICIAEEDKYDLEVKMRKQQLEINELTIAVNDIRGAFVKPVLRKIVKTDTQFDKLTEYRKKKAEEEE